MPNKTRPNAHKDSSARPDPDALFRVAEGQAGYFATWQAAQVGYSRSLVAHHAGSGVFERTATGVYRLTRYPASDMEDLFRVWLLLGPTTVISHESAMAVYGLSELVPGEIHATVPRSASRRRTGIRLHTAALAPKDVTSREGLPVTTVERTLMDVTRTGMSPEIVEQAVREALERGLTDTERLTQATAAASVRTRRILARAMSEAQG
jgi:predicted transcriptional regulator of viral defense system